jgi:hypothetical protein
MTDSLQRAVARVSAQKSKILPVSKKITDKFEFFKWLMATHKTLSREALLERLAAAPNFQEAKDASDTELLALYCEGMVVAFEASGLRADGQNHP